METAVVLDNTRAVILGVLQGFTEFLPVSSSGHLVLGQRLLGLTEPEMLFDVAVHLGTLLAVLAVFWPELWSMVRGLWARDEAGRQGRRLLMLVVVGSIPAGLAGFMLKDLFESLFASVMAVGVALLVTGALLMLTRLAPPPSRGLMQTGVGRALWVGVFQALAICPGISRSGSTIAAALLAGMDRSLAARFSFVLSVPAILGAMLLQLIHLKPGSPVALEPMLVGGAVAAISGYVALKLLLKVVDSGRLHLFAWYCFALGLLALGWSWFFGG